MFFFFKNNKKVNQLSPHHKFKPTRNTARCRLVSFVYIFIGRGNQLSLCKSATLRQISMASNETFREKLQHAPLILRPFTAIRGRERAVIVSLPRKCANRRTFGLKMVSRWWSVDD